MINTDKINEFVQAVIAAMPEGLKNLPQEVSDNLRIAIQAAFTKMDLVTHEEFDAQVGVLRRSREKLDKLEKKLFELEQQQ